MNYPYVKNGGEMGELIHNFNWSSTSLGTMDHWPSSLLTTLGIITHSKFPMLLYWGSENICIYNDAFRPSLGKDGKHPSALGMKGEDVWPEIWADIEPIIDFVLAGKGATYSEDQLLPIFRNGKLENVYWTFSYSPVIVENLKIGGVFVTCAETTERVVSLNNIKRSEKRFQNLIREATLGIAVLIGSDMVVEIVNDSFSSIFNRKFEQLIDRPLFSVVPEASDNFFDLCLEVIKSDKAVRLYNHSYLFPFSSGITELYLNVTIQPFREGDGTVKGIIMICQNVTSQMLDQKKAVDSEHHFHNLIAEASVATAVFAGPDMKLEEANDAILNIWGKTNEVIGMPIIDFLPEIEGQAFRTQLDQVFTSGKLYWVQDLPILLHKDHEWSTVYMDFSYMALRNTNRKISGVLVMGTDVTERVVVTRKVEMAEERGRLAINSAELGIYEIDILTGHFICDARVDEILGEGHSLNIEDIYRIIFEKDFIFSKGATRKSFKSEVLDYKVRLAKVGQPVHWVRNKGTILYNESGDAFKIIGVLQDITDQVVFADTLEINVRQRTRELADANHLLQLSNVELNQFVYVASHDLQEPLRKVVTYIGYLEASLKDISSESLDYIVKIKNSSSRMRILIDDVLRFSQLSKERENFMSTDLNLVMEEILKDYELLILQKQGEIIIDQLPVIDAIPLQMTQLFTNLISNALKFSSEERAFRITVKAKVLTADELRQYPELNSELIYWQLTFKDNGIGFSMEYRKQIFNIFQRLHGKSRYEGTGIGLALCKKILMNHDGIIYADSEQNKGATFFVILPETRDVTHSSSVNLLED